MNELENVEGRSLLILGAGHQFISDLQQIKPALELAKLSGHTVKLEQLWTNGHIGSPVIVQAIEGSGVKAGYMTEAAALTVAEIEIGRYQTLPDELLAVRERNIKHTLFDKAPDLTTDTYIRGFADIVIKLGGAAVIAGNNYALQSAAGYYDDFRQLG